MRVFIILLLLVITGNNVSAQQTDTLNAHRDSFYTIHENVPKSKFLGNSWNIAVARNVSYTSELNVQIGRTYGSSYCGGAGCIYTMKSWGAGYSWARKNGRSANTINAFREYSFFYFPPYAITFRGDYVYEITNKTHYLRPSAGFNLFFIDFLYNYSFKLNGNTNLFKHGFTIRLKYFHKLKKWEKNYPNRC